MAVPQARIWAYDYNSNCYSDNAQEVDTLGLGDTFLEILRGARDKGIGERIMIFIGSCFGGIVIAQVRRSTSVCLLVDLVPWVSLLADRETPGRR